ncbi:MAG TPA: HAMP domain-containing sensor histidine kinase [Thermoanaerobaculia bacterium]|jgi:signal transduction histidine kinase
MEPRARSVVAPATWAVLLLLAGLVVVDLFAIRGLVRARREAVAAAEAEVGLRVELEARTLEAALAAARVDLGVLSGAAPLAVATPADPVLARRARLEAESALLLFAVGHPVLDELVLEVAGVPSLRIGRAGAEPLVLALAAARIDAPLSTQAQIGERRMLVARAGGAASLALLAAPANRVRLRPDSEPPATPGADELVASAQLEAIGWRPEMTWRVERSEPRRALLARVERLAADFRQTLAIHLTLIVLSCGLGGLALRSVTRTAWLAAERALAEERRELERRVWHADRLASVGRLAAGIAHEINNPLAGMTTWLDLLEEDVGAGERRRARETAARLRGGLERIRDIVRRTLLFAAPGHGLLEPLDLATVVSETVEFVAALEEGLAVSVDLPLEPVLVAGDRAALGQLLLNLLLNAAQVQGPGGAAEVRLRGEWEHAVLVVEDRGPGIPAELVERLFEPFVSGRGSTGLGLAVCHGIARAHRGTIEGENRAQGGARFVVRIPRLPGREAA